MTAPLISGTNYTATKDRYAPASRKPSPPEQRAPMPGTDIHLFQASYPAFRQQSPRALVTGPLNCRA